MNYLSVNHPTTLVAATLQHWGSDAAIPQQAASAFFSEEVATKDEAIDSRLEYGSTHREIVELCKKNNRQAQFELYRLYSKAMYNVCLRMVRDELDAEDLLQSSFCDIFTKLHTFKYQSTVGAWIKRIVVNNCINHLKKRRLYFEEINDRTISITDIETSSEPNYNIEAINKAILQLPDGYRVVFSLYLLEGYDHKEIADVLGISEATSKSQYSRAKTKLRDLLGSYELVRV